jgi:hypothetical protein
MNEQGKYIDGAPDAIFCNMGTNDSARDNLQNVESLYQG